MKTYQDNFQINEMNTPWFESPFFEELLEKSDLDDSSKEKVKFFADNGYIIVDVDLPNFDKISANIIQSLAEEQKVDSRVQDAWRYQKYVKSLACHQTLLDLLKIFYQRNPIPFQTLNFSRGTEQATHSDLIHFSSVPQLFMAGVWIALEDVGPHNGPLHYYPGSHRLPFYDMFDIGIGKSTVQNRNEKYKNYEEFIQKLIERNNLEKQLVQMKKGQALIWAANLLHGGEPIQFAESTRHSQVTHYYFSDCRYYNPMYSDQYLGKIAWKQIIDIRNEQKVSHVYNGQQVSLPWKIRMRYLIENTLRNHQLGRTLIHVIKRNVSK